MTSLCDHAWDPRNPLKASEVRARCGRRQSGGLPSGRWKQWCTTTVRCMGREQSGDTLIHIALYVFYICSVLYIRCIVYIYMIVYTHYIYNYTYYFFCIGLLGLSSRRLSWIQKVAAVSPQSPFRIRPWKRSQSLLCKRRGTVDQGLPVHWMGPHWSHTKIVQL